MENGYSKAKNNEDKLWPQLSHDCRRHKPADKIADDIGMTHDDLIAVLLLLGVSPVDVAAEGCLNASSIFVVLLEDGREVENDLCHTRGILFEPLLSVQSQYMMLLCIDEYGRKFHS